MIGGVVVAIIMVIGPITAASLNPARAFGPELVLAIGGGTTHWNQMIPVYLLPGFAARRSRRSPTTSSRRRGSACSRSRAQSRIPTPSKPSRPSRKEPEWLLSPHR